MAEEPEGDAGTGNNPAAAPGIGEHLATDRAGDGSPAHRLLPSGSAVAVDAAAIQRVPGGKARLHVGYGVGVGGGGAGTS